MTAAPQQTIRIGPPAQQQPKIPYSIDAERAVLGCILIDNAALAHLDELEDADFYDLKHKIIFGAIRNLTAKKQHADVVTVEAEIVARHGHADGAGGVAYLGMLVLSPPFIDRVDEYADVIRVHRKNRDAIVALSSALHRAQTWQHDPSDLVAEIAGDLHHYISQQPTGDKPSRVTLLRDLAGPVIEQSLVPKMDWGIAGLNSLAPLPIRSMATLMGPTGGGKTALALTIASHRARYGKTPGPDQGPTIYVQLELTPAQLAARRTSQIAPYTWSQVLGGALRQDEIETILEGEHVYVIKLDRRSNVIEQARRALDEVARFDPGTPLLVVDYLQRIRGEGRDARDATAQVVDDLVDLVEGRDMYGLLLSKTSRDGSRRSRDGKTAGEALVDAASETNAIESGSAVVLAITYEDRDGEEMTDSKLVVAKARYGRTGAAVGMRFDGAHGRWDELDAIPVPKSERDAAERVLAYVRSQPNGVESRNAIYAAVKGKRKPVMDAIARELVPGGRLFISQDQRIRAEGAVVTPTITASPALQAIAQTAMLEGQDAST